MPDSPNLFAIIDYYIADLFAPTDDALEFALNQARIAGLPEIQVSASQGKLIYLLARMAGARRILEIGTLGGYSTIWLARALPAGGRMVTLELEERHADIARANIARAGLAGKVEIIVGSALETLPKLCDEAPEPFDFVFLDADKVSYLTYFIHIMKIVRSGSVILADNVVRDGAVLAPRHDDPSAAAVRSFNAMLAADERLEALVLQQVGMKGHDGLAIARVK